MRGRGAVLGVVVLGVLAAAGLWALGPAPPDAPPDPPISADPDTGLPVPPVPPRIAEGPEYEGCLAMLARDPAGARDAAEGWAGRGGGDGATHCLGLAVIALGDPAAGARMLQDLATASHAPAAARALLFGQADHAWLMVGDNPHALEAATLALRLAPADVDRLVDHATVAGTLGRYNEALDDLARALEADPSRADALVLRGSTHRHLGQLDAAQNDVDRALLIDPDNAEALLERGILRQRVDDAAGARRDWERAISLEPDSPIADLAQQDLALLDAGPGGN